MIVIIPARGGSVRVPRKNMQDVGGMTLVERAFRLACELDVGRVVVSSDDFETLHLFPPECRHARFAHGDVAMDTVLGELPTHEWRVLLQPTTPTRTAEDVLGALAVAKILTASCQTVHRTEPHSWRRNGAAIVLPPMAMLCGGPWAIVETPERIDIDTPEDLERVRGEWPGA